MSSEFFNKLNSRIANHNGVSPNRIQQLQKQERSINIITDLLPNFSDDVLSMLETSNGKLKRDKIAKLQESIDSLKHEFKLEDFLKIDLSCLDKNGTIDEAKFRTILNDKK